MNSAVLLLRLARFRRECKKLPEIRIPESVRKAAEAQGFRFNQQKEKQR